MKKKNEMQVLKEKKKQFFEEWKFTRIAYSSLSSDDHLQVTMETWKKNHCSLLLKTPKKRGKQDGVKLGIDWVRHPNYKQQQQKKKKKKSRANIELLISKGAAKVY